MNPKGKQVMPILAALFLILFGLARAEIKHEEAGDANVGACLGKCGDDMFFRLISCFMDVTNFLSCGMRCVQSNASCMGRCVKAEVPPFSNPAQPPLAWDSNSI